jgi:hypothetical protein
MTSNASYLAKVGFICMGIYFGVRHADDIKAFFKRAPHYLEQVYQKTPEQQNAQILIEATEARYR